MTTHKPDLERRLITQNHPTRPYGANVKFQILHAKKIGEIGNAPIELESGALATVTQVQSSLFETGVNFQVALEGFPTATLA